MAGLLVLLGCAQQPATTAATATAGQASATSARSSETAPTAPADDTVTLAFAGDIHFSGRLEPVLSRPDPLVAALRPVLGGADIAVVNLETAITSRGTPEPKQFHFRTSAQALTILADSGADVASMANNHGVDYGRQGLDDTLEARRHSPLPIIGIGENAEQAYAPAVIEVRGTSVAVLAASQIPDKTAEAWSADDDSAGIASALTSQRLVEAVTAARAANDVVVVFMHWGTDYTNCPNRAQRDLVEQVVAVGADVVVGTHAHEMQGAGWTGDGSAYVGYGLGNFVWWRSNTERSIATGVLTLTLDGRRTTSAEWTPMRIGDDGIPAQLTGADAQANLGRWDEVRDCADLLAAPPS